VETFRLIEAATTARIGLRSAGLILSGPIAGHCKASILMQRN
jgi:hypothetical protein